MHDKIKKKDAKKKKKIKLLATNHRDHMSNSNEHIRPCYCLTPTPMS